MTDNSRALLDDLRGRGFRLKRADAAGGIRITPADTLAAEDVAAIRANRQGLLALLDAEPPPADLPRTTFVTGADPAVMAECDAMISAADERAGLLSRRIDEDPAVRAAFEKAQQAWYRFDPAGLRVALGDYLKVLGIEEPGPEGRHGVPGCADAGRGQS